MTRKREKRKPENYEVAFTVKRPLAPFDRADPADYWFAVKGEIHALDENGEPVGVAGWISARVIEVGRALNDQVDLFEVVDAEDDNLARYGSTFLDMETGGFRDDLCEGAASDLLIVERIELLPEHRGMKLGHFALVRTIDTFGRGCGAVAIEPSPLQHREVPQGGEDWVKKMEFDRFKSTKATALKKLRAHWSALGFRPVTGTDFFVLDLARQRPSLEEGLGETD